MSEGSEVERRSALTDDAAVADASDAPVEGEELHSSSGAERVEEHAPSTAELLDRLQKRQEEYRARYRETATAPDYVDRLQRAGQQFLEDGDEFNPGDLVMWKRGLKNKLLPDYGKPAYVVGVNPEGESDEDSDEFDPRNLYLGVLTGDDDFRIFQFDRRRFTLWVPDS